MKEEKMNFFVRLKKAIFNLEDYNIFANEKTSKALKYFFQIVLIVACVFAAISASNFVKMFKKGFSYVKNELPDFSYSDGKLNMESYVEGYDEEYGMYFIADTSENLSTEKIDEYKNKISDVGIIALKDKLVFISGGISTEYSYVESLEGYDVTECNKQSVIEEVEKISDAQIFIIIFIVFLFVVYISEVISLMLDWFVISVFAWCVSKICKVNFNFKNAFGISIYALTLPIVLTIVYEISNEFLGFYTEYFRIVYLLISYVYVVAAILMMKSDVIKQEAIVGKIKDDNSNAEKNDLDEKKLDENNTEENNENENETQTEENVEDNENNVNNESGDSEYNN